MLRPLKLSIGPPRVGAVAGARGRVVQTPPRAKLGAGRRRLCCRSAIEEAEDATEVESVNGNGARGSISLVGKSRKRVLRRAIWDHGSPFAP